jgi:hypothetical protein
MTQKPFWFLLDLPKIGLVSPGNQTRFNESCVFQNRRRPRFQVSTCVLVNENASFLFQFSRGNEKSQAVGAISFINRIS